MSNEIRGSEKLKMSCTGLTPLDEQELNQVVGGYSAAQGYWRVFPLGVPWPDIFRGNPIDEQVVNPQKLGQGF